jgi:hypothetical protein
VKRGKEVVLCTFGFSTSGFRMGAFWVPRGGYDMVTAGTQPVEFRPCAWQLRPGLPNYSGTVP